MVFWGINWPIMKIALTEIPVVTFRVACVWFGGIALLSASALARQDFMPSKRILVPLVLVSMVNVAGWQIFSATGLTYLPAGRGVIIAFTMPIWASLLASFFLNEAFTKRKVTGLAFGVAGLAALIAPDLGGVLAAPEGVLAMLAAALSWAMGTVYLKRVDWNMPTLALTGWQMIVAGIPLGIWGAVQGFDVSLGSLSPIVIWCAAYAIIVPMTFSYWAWMTVVRTSPAALAAIGTLGIPVMGVLSGAVILGETIGLPEISALLLVSVGLAVVLLPKDVFSKSKSSAP